MSDVLLPPNATTQEFEIEQSTSRINVVPVPVRDIWNADTCPDALLPWLAWAYSVDEWDATWTSDQRREAIKSSVAVHRYKGTIGAVRNALAALGFDVAIQEWFNMLPQGVPYTFGINLTTDQIGIDQPALARILQVIDSTKNLRSHIEGITPIVVTASEIFIGSVPMIGTETDVLSAYSAAQVADLMTALSQDFLGNTASLDAFDSHINITMPAVGYW